MNKLLSAAERIDKIMPGHAWHPFDFHNNPLCYDPAPEPGTEYTERLLAQTRVAHVAANEASAGLPFAFVPCSMSNGWLAYQLAEDYKDLVLKATKTRTGTAYLTTQNLKNYVAPAELMNRVIQPNRQQNQTLIDQAERRFPAFSVIGPVDFEGPLRIAKSDHALSQGATFQDWTFESWWVPRVADCDHMILAGDHAYSRYANTEELLGDLVQCGFYHDVRNGRQMDITDINGRPVPLSDRAWERAKHVVNVVERDFHTDLAVSTLLAQFQIHDWLQEKNPALDLSRVHPALLNRSKADIDRMEKLKAMMLPYIAAKCLDWTPYKKDKGLSAYCEREIFQKTAALPDIKKLQETLFRYQPKGGFQYPASVVEAMTGSKPKAQKSFEVADRVSLPKHRITSDKRRGTEGDYFAGKWNAAFFDDHHFEKLFAWEKAALPFLMGSMEAHRLPENNPRTAFYACDTKGGPLARDWMQKNDQDWIKEAKSPKFKKEVMEPNRLRDTANVQSLLQSASFASRDFGNVLSTRNIINIDSYIEKNRIFVAASGAPKLTSRARLALQMKWMDRNADALVVRDGWEISPDDTRMVVRALLIATGQVDRPAESKYRMEIFQDGPENGQNRLKKLDLADVIKTLGHQVEDWLDLPAAPPARENYVAIARMLQLLDMHIDPARMNVQQKDNEKTGAVKGETLIHWDRVDSDLLWSFYDHPEKKREIIELRDRLRPKLLAIAVQHMEQEDVKDLHEDYQDAWNKVHGLIGFDKRRKFEGDRSFVEQRGIAVK